ncbi:MAG: alkaline phosphatase family protein, partial [bacterium]|nr:alkaline phosphatase family protein [bacterium]
MNRVFFIGIDAGDLKYIEPLIKRNKLPNFRKIIFEGAYAELISTVPPLTPVAWTSMLSGLDKNEHQIYSWTKFSDNLREIIPINSNDIKVPRIWDILNRFGKKTVVVNVPLTYPAYEIDGVMISGFDANSNDDNAISMPEHVNKIFKEKFPDYNIVVEYKNIYKGIEKFKALWEEDCRKKTEVFLELMTETRAEFGILVYMIIDHLNHYIPYGLKKHRGILEWAYSVLDDELGKVMSKMDPDDSIVICSDHGSIFIKQNFYINKWFEDNGYLKFFNDKLPQKIFRNAYIKLSTKLPIFKIFGENFGEKLFRFSFAILPRLFKEKVVNKIRNKTVLGYSFDCIDMENSEVFCKEAYGQIFINERRLKYEGERYEKIEEVLIKLKKDASAGRIPEFHVLEKKATRDSINEPHIEIQLEFEDIYFNVFNFSNNSPYFEVNKQSYRGDHRKKGIFLALGKDIKPFKKARKLKMKEVVPFILALISRRVPGYLSDRVPKDLFNQSFDIEIDKREMSDFILKTRSSSEEENTKRKLENLG